MGHNLWIDVEDLFEYARDNPRPSGIQRLAFEIYKGLHSHAAIAGKVHFVRHAPLSNSFRVVEWTEVAALFARLTEGKVVAKPHLQSLKQHGPGRQRLRRLVQRLPTSLRPIIIDMLLTSAAAGRAWLRLLCALMAGVQRAPGRLIRRYFRTRPTQKPLSPNSARPANGAAIRFEAPNFETVVQPDDVILVLGSPWFHPHYAGMVGGLRAKLHLRLAMLVYDIIPLRRPEWCDAGLVRLFRAWFEPMLPICDHIFAISQATAADVNAYAATRGIRLARDIVPLPIGTGLSVPFIPPTNSHLLKAGALDGSFTETQSDHEVSRRELPPPGSYALVVSTIEARKNHLLLFRIWRRLLEESAPEQIPTLVFAGRIGWLVDDLMRQIRNTENLGGKLVIVENPTDAELSMLYTGCLFTVFPSFYEGWGLPVTESLALGKPCLISNRTSLPEAGGDLTRSFDPDNLNDAYVAIRNVIDHPDDLAAWEAQVRRDFKLVPWSATVQALLHSLGMVGASSAQHHDAVSAPMTSIS